jgi:hypothetical protein
VKLGRDFDEQLFVLANRLVEDHSHPGQGRLDDLAVNDVRPVAGRAQKSHAGRDGKSRRLATLGLAAFGIDAGEREATQRWLSAVIHGQKVLSEEIVHPAADAECERFQNFLGREVHSVKCRLATRLGRAANLPKTTT